MKIATTIAEVRAQVREWKQQGLTVGLVPTMGYLHEGHASLVKTSVQQCDRTVASVFLNPTQFGPGEDLETYPRDFEHDCALLTECGCDMVFHPEVSEMYPDGFATFVEVQSDMPRQLCGKTRPIHFRGVCTVVSKLFNIVTPDKAFFGQKDAQQLAIIRRMVLDLSMGIEIVGCPIIREADGLAKSSRNTYLSAEERKAAGLSWLDRHDPCPHHADRSCRAACRAPCTRPRTRSPAAAAGPRAPRHRPPRWLPRRRR